jgi:ribosome maturation factor RimP
MGATPPIFFWGLDPIAEPMMDLFTLLDRTLPGMGYELVDVQTSSKGRLVRVFIDKPNGVDVEDCARVSDHLTRLFAVESIDYDRLEVSSPGLDRLLRKQTDFERFSGEDAQVRLRTMLDNRRNFTGTLRGVRDGNVLLETDAGTSALPLDAIERARLIPKIDWSRK